MWWAGNKVRDVYLGTRAVAVCHGSDVLVAEPTEGFDESLSGLQAWIESAAPRLRLRVWLSGGLCRPFILAPVAGAKTDVELTRIATSLAGQRTGLDEACRVWLEPRKLGESKVAVAIQESTLLAIQKMLATSSKRPRALSIQPWWSEMLRHVLVRKPGAKFVSVRDCDSVTVLAGDEIRYDFATTYGPVVDDDTARAVRLRALMSSGISEEDDVVGQLVVTAARSAKDSGDLRLGPLAEVFL